jgi:hypothetical protein
MLFEIATDLTIGSASQVVRGSGIPPALIGHLARNQTSRESQRGAQTDGRAHHGREMCPSP